VIPSRGSVRFIALAVVLAGCGDPGIHIRGQAKVAPDACGKAQGDVYTSAGPIAGAVVRLRCGGRSTDIATTDATGHFEYQRLGLLDLGCSIAVEKEGYKSQTFALENICIQQPYGGAHCASVNVQAELTPAR
jgi:hypothetical protein